MAHILHEDLRKASGDDIKNELQYLVNSRIPQIMRGINLGLHAILCAEKPELPLWMCNQDLAAACDRFQAIVEELQYRSEI